MKKSLSDKFKFQISKTLTAIRLIYVDRRLTVNVIIDRPTSVTVSFEQEEETFLQASQNAKTLCYQHLGL